MKARVEAYKEENGYVVLLDAEAKEIRRHKIDNMLDSYCVGFDDYVELNIHERDVGNFKYLTNEHIGYAVVKILGGIN